MYEKNPWVFILRMFPREKDRRRMAKELAEDVEVV